MDMSEPFIMENKVTGEILKTDYDVHSDTHYIIRHKKDGATTTPKVEWEEYSKRENKNTMMIIISQKKMIEK